MKREGGKTSVVVRRGGRCFSKQFVFSSVRVRDRTKKRERGRRAWSSVVCHRLSSGFFKPIVFFLSFCLIFPSISPVSSDTIRPPPGTRRSKISNSWYHYCIKWLVLSSAFSVLFQEKNSHFILLFICFSPLPSVVISNPSCVCSFFLFLCPCFCFLVFKSLFF
jgi:hypothetical protein